MKKGIKILALTAALASVFSSAVFAMPDNKAATGPGLSRQETPVQTEAPAGASKELTPEAPSPVGNSQASLAKPVMQAIDSGSNGPVTVDPILGLVPDVHVQFKTGDGNLTDGFTTNTDMFTSPLDGFCGLKCRFENCIGDVFYRVHTEEHGWSRWAMNEMDTDWFNDAAKVTAVQLRIKGHTRNLYDLYYRVVLEDGTALDWAHDGQTSGTIGTGHYIQKMQVMLWKHGMAFGQSTQRYFLGANYEGLTLDGSGYPHYQTASGAAYTGWAYDTDNNKYYFADSNPVTGWQDIGGYRYYFDDKGRVVTDLEPVMGLTGSYIIKVNKDMKTMTVFTKNPDTGEFNVPYKVFLCTIGSSTPTGTFKTYEPHRWKFMHDDIYVQYLLRYKDSGFCIHSIIYQPAEGSYNLVASTYNQLGKNYSDGCIRLLSGDAAWLYNNCGAGTQLTIYNDYWVMGPFDRPAIEQGIPMGQRYDPTDPVVISDMTNHTGPFAGGSYNGAGYETPYSNAEAAASANAALVAETPVG